MHKSIHTTTGMGLWTGVGHSGVYITINNGVQDQQGLIFMTEMFPLRGWATPGGTAIPGQPVERAKQASIHVPWLKN